MVILWSWVCNLSTMCTSSLNGVSRGVFGVGVGAPILANCDPSEGVYLRFFVVNACMRVK